MWCVTCGYVMTMAKSITLGSSRTSLSEKVITSIAFFCGRDLNENKKFSAAYSVFDSSVNKCWHLNGVAEAVKMPNYVSINDWLVGCALLLVYGVGVLVLGALIYLRLSGRKSTDGAKRAQLDLLSEIKGHHQKLIDDLYATQQKREPDVAVAFS